MECLFEGERETGVTGSSGMSGRSRRRKGHGTISVTREAAAVGKREREVG